MDDFKVPSDIPQDLLLIQSIVGITEEHSKSLSKTDNPNQNASSTATDISSSDSSIASSDSGLDSEDEIESELKVAEEKEDVVTVKTEEKETPLVVAESESDDDSDSSSSDSSDDDSTEADPQRKDKVPKEEEEEGMDDEDAGPSTTTQSYFRTKNEVADTAINVPDIEEVGSDEYLERVGEVMNVVENVAIVRGLPSEVINRGAEKALDSDTLLVFGDRKVMGYIYETFGPTTQPLYQVRFNSSYPLDPEKVRLSREVFHVPHRSNFVFTRRIAAMKGSDASNMNDEEPAEHELEFSDDEAEAEYKRNLKKKRAGSRASSVVSTRHSTPTPSQMRDQDLNGDYYSMGANAYAEVSPYDADYDGVVSARPAPKPYDDPYSDEYTSGASSSTPARTSAPPSVNHSQPSPNTHTIDDFRSRARGSRGRGRGGRRGGGGGGYDRSQSRDRPRSEVPYSDFHTPYPPGPQHYPQQQQLPHLPQQQLPPQWPYQANPAAGMQYQGMPFQQPFIQPHINPRFAAQFGMNMNMQQGPSGMQPGHFMNPVPQPANQAPHWSDQWTVHGGSNQGSGEGSAGHR
ncbi:hypothetical protein PQX77_001911 [Marasmius sp. AFHP31]|nr:hypothetical protein PQX77_001911 [Marasmius sp. AFHP31]